ncbi:MAG TPA: DUF423 domain-containing protein [Candidatus Krumholzibacteria bacterium]|nr:DUF423 domain-containing protein [Candidatus Krumholzibacteria bacterium]
MSIPRSTDRTLLRTAAVLGAIGVAAGAFGAHGLAEHVPPRRLDTFDTGVRLLMAHVPVMLLVSVLHDRFDPARLRWAGSFFVAGTVVFSGSLFALVLLDMPWLGAITPIGGVCLIAAWLLLVWAVGRGRVEDQSSESR